MVPAMGLSLGLPATPPLPPDFRHAFVRLAKWRLYIDLRCNVPPPVAEKAAWKSPPVTPLRDEVVNDGWLEIKGEARVPF